MTVDARGVDVGGPPPRSRSPVSCSSRTSASTTTEGRSTTQRPTRSRATFERGLRPLRCGRGRWARAFFIVNAQTHGNDPLTLRAYDDQHLHARRRDSDRRRHRHTGEPRPLGIKWTRVPHERPGLS
jgi:hypothetical protein